MLFATIRTEITPPEDRSVAILSVTAPPTVSLDYLTAKMREIEDLLAPLRASGEVRHVFLTAGQGGEINRGFVALTLAPWGERTRSQDDIVAEIDERLAGVIGVRAQALRPNSLGIRNAGRGLPSVHGALVVFDDATGAVRAVIDSALVTKWKTAADSILGARLLARPDSRRLLILGAGAVAASLIEAYRAEFPGIEVTLWNRSPERARALAAEYGAAVAEDLPAAVAAADIVSSATMSTRPILRGAWLRPGQHLDLIGAYKADMREADDEALLREYLSELAPEDYSFDEAWRDYRMATAYLIVLPVITLIWAYQAWRHEGFGYLRGFVQDEKPETD